jgi:hypothetical protein
VNECKCGSYTINLNNAELVRNFATALSINTFMKKSEHGRGDGAVERGNSVHFPGTGAKLDAGEFDAWSNSARRRLAPCHAESPGHDMPQATDVDWRRSKRMDSMATESMTSCTIAKQKYQSRSVWPCT